MTLTDRELIALVAGNIAGALASLRRFQNDDSRAGPAPDAESVAINAVRIAQRIVERAEPRDPNAPVPAWIERPAYGRPAKIGDRVAVSFTGGRLRGRVAGPTDPATHEIVSEANHRGYYMVQPIDLASRPISAYAVRGFEAGNPNAIKPGDALVEIRGVPGEMQLRPVVGNEPPTHVAVTAAGQTGYLTARRVRVGEVTEERAVTTFFGEKPEPGPIDPPPRWPRTTPRTSTAQRSTPTHPTSPNRWTGGDERPCTGGCSRGGEGPACGQPQCPDSNPRPSPGDRCEGNCSRGGDGPPCRKAGCRG